MSAALFDNMMMDADRWLRAIGSRSARSVALVSGAAAWADHVAVRLFLERRVAGLDLHLPAALEGGRFAEDPSRGRFDPGRTANYYHDIFSASLKADTLAESGRAIELGAGCTVGRDFRQRNTTVARSAEAVIAYTFGDRRAKPSLFKPEDPGFSDAAAAGVKDGGTMDTYLKARTCRIKIHVPLWQLMPKPGAAASLSPQQTAIDLDEAAGGPRR
jgi:hypothetical protein